MKPFRVAIIGAGNLSTRRIYPNIGVAGGRIVGVCDFDQEKATNNASLFGGNVYTDYKVMLEKENPDGVIICIGPEAHYSLSKEVMTLGYPVYTEKPSAPDASSAFEMAKISNDLNVLCTTAFKKRYALCNLRAKEWLSKFDEKDFYSISIDYASGSYRNDSSKTMFLLDFAIHIIDLTLYLFGDVKKVMVFSKNKNAYAVSLMFENGAVGSLNLNDGRSFSVPTEEIEITVKGGNFMTIHNSCQWKIYEKGASVEFREPAMFTSAGDSGSETGHLTEIKAFFEAVKNNTSTLSNIYESYKSLVLFDAINKSAETGEIVNIKYQTLNT